MGSIGTHDLNKDKRTDFEHRKVKKFKRPTQKSISSANIVPSNREFKPEHVDKFLKKEGYVKDDKKAINKKDTKKADEVF